MVDEPLSDDHEHIGRCPVVSVIVCTHNPHVGRLSRTLSGLQAQTLPYDRWELIVVDNASSAPVAGRLDVSWHPDCRIVAEPQLGLTNARIRGINAARGHLLVFVDDDNVLAGDFLRTALSLSDSWPQLGAWGGSISPEYEVAANPELAPWYPHLALREVTADRWGNDFVMEATPYGAGLVIRRIVAQQYVAMATTSPMRRLLDRTGQSLISCGDVDLAWTSIDLGLGIGVFSSLRVTHLIPETRMRVDYLLRIVEGITASHMVLDYVRQRRLPARKRSLPRQAVDQLRLLRSTPLERRFAQAKQRGRELGWRLIDDFRRAAETETVARSSHG